VSAEGRAANREEYCEATKKGGKKKEAQRNIKDN
jgi:hypothetical protein